MPFRVGVQCKRYADGDQVTPRHIREFQGASGALGSRHPHEHELFTQQAKDPAGAPSYKLTDLIDGERLVELLIGHRLGIKGVTVATRISSRFSG